MSKSSVALNGASDRSAEIRAAADQMRSILAEKIERADTIDRQIADLQAEREEILRRLESTLGVVVPQIDKPVEPTVAPVPDIPELSKRELVFQTLWQHGAMTAHQLQELVGNVAVVSAHLTHLKSQKRVLHVGNMWSAKQQHTQAGSTSDEPANPTPRQSPTNGLDETRRRRSRI